MAKYVCKSRWLLGPGLGSVTVLGWTGTSHLRALITAVGFFLAAVVVPVW